MSTKGRLRRSFPAHAVGIDLEKVGDKDFQAAVAHALALMSHQPVAGMQPQVKKGGETMDENRDTTHPGMITEFLNGFLTANGAATKFDLIGKKTREDILWSKAKAPWRRSPFWLLIRVSLQLSCCRVSGSIGEGTRLYKQILIFFVSYIMRISEPLCLPTELLHIMRAKLARRLCKLKDEIDACLLEHLKDTIGKNASIMSERWEYVQESDAWRVDTANLESLDFDRDRFMNLPELDQFITAIRNRKKDFSAGDFSANSDLKVYVRHQLPSGFGDHAKKDSVLQNLHSFENWIRNHLPEWLEAHVNDVNACGEIAKLTQEYHSIALQQYSGNPESYSIMILVSLELWVACDQIGIAQDALLSEYCPGLFREVLQNLLLPFKYEMNRLQRLEDYLTRRSRAPMPSKLLFEEADKPGCFAARYFEHSVEHQNLLEQIETEASQAKQNKIEEIARLKTRYENLMAQHRATACDHYDVENRYTGLFEKHHSPSCNRCRHKRDADALSILVHEWPLPDNPTKAKTVVFELRVPPWYRYWRDTTVYIMSRVIGSEYLHQRKSDYLHFLCNDKQLHSRFVIGGRELPQRMELVSSVKPHIGTHRKGKDIVTATEKNTCLHSGLDYEYYDRLMGCFTESMQQTEDAPKLCTYKLPSDALQKFIYRPAGAPNGPSPNAAISGQSYCPPSMPLSHWRSLNTLPLGYHLQWWALLTQLAMPAIDLKDSNSVLTILQCIYQAGPPSSDNATMRPGHRMAESKRFANVILTQIEESLQRIKENWESVRALYILTAIVLRLHSMCIDKDVQVRCRLFFYNARRVVFDWVNVLKRKAREAEAVYRDDFISRAVEAALICASTFDVDRQYLQTLLESTGDASILIQCAAIIHEGGRSLVQSDRFITLVQCRYLRLLCDTFPILARNTDALHHAMKELWALYEPGQRWSAVPDAPHWVTTRTASIHDNESSLIHFDLVTGTLLIDGEPLGRLPPQYESHSDYERLFGRSVIEVMPATTAGLRFSAKNHHFGHDVQFGLANIGGSSELDLLVRASKASLDSTYELLPPRIFRDEVPTAFLHDFVHWYNCRTGDVEFRPVSDPWTASSSGEWRLLKGEHSKWLLTQPRTGRFLVAATSNTARAVTKILFALAQPPFIHLTLPKITDQPSPFSVLAADIPTLRIAFRLDKGSCEMYSQDYPGMSIATDQDVGTLIGLRNKLVLRHQQTSQKRLLLLDGSTSSKRQISNSACEPMVDHVDVTVNTSGDQPCRVHSFIIDSQLGRLTSNGTLQSMLVLAFLHAVTASPVPDPFTQKTGTEEALSILGSSAMRSFSKLSPESITMLVQIAKLTPEMDFYPKPVHGMQTLRWSEGLSFLSQDPNFYVQVKSILGCANAYRDLFFASSSCMPVIRDVNEELLERSRIRYATFRVSEHGAEDYTTQYDAEYNPRDRDQQSLMRTNAYLFSSHISHRRQTRHHGRPSAAGMWEFLQHSDMVFGPAHQVDLSQIKLDALLLQNNGSVLSEIWLSMHQLLGRQGAVNKFSLMLWLSALACSTGMDLTALETLALCYTSSQLQAICVPTSKSFQVSAGYQLCRQQISRAVSQSSHSFHSCPEADLVRPTHESRKKFGDRRYRLFQSNQSEAANCLTSALCSQWPCETLATPSVYCSVDMNTYIDVKSAVGTVQPTFRSWYRNLQLFEYLQRIENATLALSHVNITVPGWLMPIAEFSETHSDFVSAVELFLRVAPSLEFTVCPLAVAMSSNHPGWDTLGLNSIISKLEQSSGPCVYKKEYVESLKSSVNCLTESSILELPQLPTCQEAENQLQFWKTQAQNFYKLLEGAFEPTSKGALALDVIKMAQQWPRVRPAFFFHRLQRYQWCRLSASWKAIIAQYAIIFTLYQRADRILNACRAGRVEDVAKELSNPGHTNWDPLQYPERILLELDSQIMIRSVQIDVADVMESPKSGTNTSMQLNMGEGKSSVIAPIVAAALADGSRLVRIIVGKPQAKQMAQMLVAKLGGMIGRRVYFMPFSRQTELNESEIQKLQALYQECMVQGGIMLLQPEHILSFQLMGVERCISGDAIVGGALLRTQQFFDRTCRDIVDESDENFSVKFELIYSIGTQRHIDASPGRWLCIQQILDLVAEVAPEVAKLYPDGLEIRECSPGGFPRMRLLDDGAHEDMLERIAHRICDGGLPGFPIQRQSPVTRRAIFAYISKYDLTEEQIQDVEEGPFWTDIVKSKLFLLRGLLAHGILAFAFGQKRWRVNYGCDNTRNPPTRLAVPYRAKDMPTTRSEFSHPDVVIILTALSYYYAGLTDEYIRSSLSHLAQSDQKDVEYASWVRNISKMPPAFRHFDGINLQDRSSCANRVFPILQSNKKAVDYFLANIVFPKEIKEFPNKLSASGWDIGRIKSHPTTAFSGTSDSCVLLPLDVQYDDSKKQRHTNALVLEYLRREENKVHCLPAVASSHLTDAMCLLTEVVNMDPSPRVLLDAGAQIIEMCNLDVASSWLDMCLCNDIRAAVFFDDSDELAVITREGHVESLQTSSFADQLGSCIVFLDQAHTRGTDLKLPLDYRAAVTLGPGLTKDKLVQGK